MRQMLERALVLGKNRTHEGKVATYIPELGRIDPDLMGISIFSISGERMSVGDSDVRFTMQSISNIFGLAVALDMFGFEKVFQNVGMEPSGDPYNSLMKLERNEGTPYNPMINAGAMVIDSYLVPKLSIDQMLNKVRSFCMDPDIIIDEDIYNSEMENLSHNRAIGYLLESKGYIDVEVERVLDFYVKMCSMSATTKSLAGMGLVLANDGIHPGTGERMLSGSAVKVVKTIMTTCGMYDGSGEFAVRAGIPSKSGVGGGILSVIDRELGIGIYGPALDPKGNSLGGEVALEFLSQQLHLHMFDHGTLLK